VAFVKEKRQEVGRRGNIMCKQMGWDINVISFIIDVCLVRINLEILVDIALEKCKITA
jgi:hypothetical protein